MRFTQAWRYFPAKSPSFGSAEGAGRVKNPTGIMFECQHINRIKRPKMILSRTDRVQIERVYVLFYTRQWNAGGHTCIFALSNLAIIAGTTLTAQQSPSVPNCRVRDVPGQFSVDETFDQLKKECAVAARNQASSNPESECRHQCRTGTGSGKLDSWPSRCDDRRAAAQNSQT